MRMEDRVEAIKDDCCVTRKKYSTRVDTFTNQVIMERDGKHLASYPLQHKIEADNIAAIMNERGLDVC
jgi:hypothetical protein